MLRDTRRQQAPTIVFGARTLPRIRREETGNPTTSGRTESEGKEFVCKHEAIPTSSRCSSNGVSVGPSRPPWAHTRTAERGILRCYVAVTLGELSRLITLHCLHVSVRIPLRYPVPVQMKSEKPEKPLKWEKVVISAVVVFFGQIRAFRCVRWEAHPL